MEPDGPQDGLPVVGQSPAPAGHPPPEVYFAPDAPGEAEVANIRGTSSGAPVLVIGRRLPPEAPPQVARAALPSPHHR